MNTTPSVLGFVVAAWLAVAPPLAAQPVADDALLGRSISLGAVLSSDEALSWASYDFEDRRSLGGEMERQQVAFRRALGGESSHAFWGLFAARGDEERSLRVAGVFPVPPTRLGLQTVSLGAETGARFGLGDSAGSGRDDGWFWSPRAAASYTFADLDRRIGPGPSVESDAEALTVLGSAAIGHRWSLVLDNGDGHVELAAEAIFLHSTVLSADAGFPDGDLFTTHGRLRFAGLWPTGGEVFGAGLEIGVRARLTLLDDDLDTRGPLGYAADRHADVGLRLMARPDEGAFPVGALGLALRYVDADGLDGWSVGVVVSP